MNAQTSARKLVQVLTMAVIVLHLSKSPAEAQNVDAPRVDVTASAGYMLLSDWSDLVLLGAVSPGTGALEQVLVRDLVLDPGPVYDGTVTYWQGRLGFRAHVGYARSCLAVGRNCADIAANASEAGTVKVRSYSYDVGGSVGLLEYQPRRWAWPYVFASVGGVTYDLDRTVGPPLDFIERRSVSSPALVITDDADTLLISVDEMGTETRLTFTLGFGTDFRIPVGPAGLGVRVELSDQLHESPLNLRVATVDGFRRDDDDFVFDPVHNLRAAIGVVVQFGR